MNRAATGIMLSSDGHQFIQWALVGVGGNAALYEASCVKAGEKCKQENSTPC